MPGAEDGRPRRRPVQVHREKGGRGGVNCTGYRVSILDTPSWKLQICAPFFGVVSQLVGPIFCKRLKGDRKFDTMPLRV